MKSTILVIGSSNTDMVIKAPHLPVPGETILGGTFLMNPGGKGANQAVAAARLGGAVTFICKTGNDIFGNQSIQLFKDEGIDTAFIFKDPQQPSGVALITVDNNGENCIAVASGANANLTPRDLITVSHCIEKAAIILMQLEIPVETVAYAAAVAADHNKIFILNPAPVCALNDELLKHVSIITPNETEASMLTGIKVTDEATAEQAAGLLHARGIATVIITLGSKGALVSHEGKCSLVPTPVVQAVDTTAAGDTFNGALAAALSENIAMVAAVEFACKAAAFSVTRLGAQASAPYRHEL
ncbi:MAG: ribokinase [Ferruginibacter sp.]